jgi:hypothetical protein
MFKDRKGEKLDLIDTHYMKTISFFENKFEKQLKNSIDNIIEEHPKIDNNLSEVELENVGHGRVMKVVINSNDLIKYSLSFDRVGYTSTTSGRNQNKLYIGVYNQTSDEEVRLDYEENKVIYLKDDLHNGEKEINDYLEEQLIRLKQLMNEEW